ncbi:MAG: regulatory protein RecX [Deltaproteobacteria bacterium]|nr:regulatory protein RecX [Deltaproteobacteria bacterium]
MTSKRSGSPEEPLKRAFKFLGYRARSESEVRAKLTELGFPQKIIETTLEKLRSLNLLNDEAFARNWAQTRAESRGYGPLRIERELRGKGVAKVLIDRIVPETFGQEGGRERARALLEKRFKGKDLGDQRILHRAVGFLQRQGYRDSVIAEVLKMPMEG